MVRFHGIFIDLPNVHAGQIIQHNISNFTVRVIADSFFPVKEKELIIKRMKSQLGEDINIKIDVVSEIPRNANGKFQAVISELK